MYKKIIKTTFISYISYEIIKMEGKKKKIGKTPDKNPTNTGWKSDKLRTKIWQKPDKNRTNFGQTPDNLRANFGQTPDKLRSKTDTSDKNGWKRTRKMTCQYSLDIISIGKRHTFSVTSQNKFVTSRDASLWRHNLCDGILLI